MEPESSSETFITIYQTTRRHIPEVTVTVITTAQFILYILKLLRELLTNGPIFKGLVLFAQTVTYFTPSILQTGGKKWQRKIEMDGKRIRRAPAIAFLCSCRARGTRFPATYFHVRSVDLRTLRNHVRYWIQSQLRVSNGKKRMYQVMVFMCLLLHFVDG
jgi:hypothetical protein